MNLLIIKVSAASLFKSIETSNLTLITGQTIWYDSVYGDVTEIGRRQTTTIAGETGLQYNDDRCGATGRRAALRPCTCAIGASSSFAYPTFYIMGNLMVFFIKKGVESELAIPVSSSYVFL
ncbi:hypothetical protein EVAR_78025_1 [Eumeta japonica]|uniref:Uncharacterized protein n=1 Tax=Eumeta variegata TaxID=151549 RepID=A0A4C1SZZ6_EUMVA|nr:hypothetical protein EVAR_78025_1 [Eumeta japonica]